MIKKIFYISILFIEGLSSKAQHVNSIGTVVDSVKKETIEHVLIGIVGPK